MYGSGGFIDPTESNSSSNGNLHLDGEISPSTSSPASIHPRIVELSSTSPLTLSTDGSLALGDDNGINSFQPSTVPIITSPVSGTQSFMSSPIVNATSSAPSTSLTNNALISPTSRNTLALISSQQQQQAQQLHLQQQQFQTQDPDATLALLSGLPQSTSSPSSSTVSPTSSVFKVPGKPASASSRTVPSTGASSSSTSQSLQSVARNANGTRGNVAAFLTKLYNMVGDEASNNLIKWSDNGHSFVVPRHVNFAKEVLPKFFKHNNFSSFVRQLNMYGFHKVPHLQQGVLMPDSDTEQWEFSNPHFQRNQPDLLYLVSRKKASNGTEDKDPMTIDLGHILSEVSAIKRHQIAISSDLKNIEREHQSLWRESISARERHQRQQETIDKILRFLASVFSSEKKRAIVPSKKPRLRITDGDQLDLHEDEDELQESDDETELAAAGSKRKRPGTAATVGTDQPQSSTPGDVKITPSPPVPSLRTTATTSNPALANKNATTAPTNSDFLTNSFPALNYSNLSSFANFGSSSTPTSGAGSITLGGFKLDPSTLSLPTLLPGALSSDHQDMLRAIAMANSKENNLPLAPLPPSFSQTPTGAAVTKGVDQIAAEMEQLQKSIEALSQHGLDVDNFTFDDDTYLSLAGNYDPNSLGELGSTYQEVLSQSNGLGQTFMNPSVSSALSNMSSNTLPITTSTTISTPTMTTTSSPSSLPSVPLQSTTPISTMAIPSVDRTIHSTRPYGSNQRISTVGDEELEDLLDLDPV